jgi:hypothetical protein
MGIQYCSAGDDIGVPACDCARLLGRLHRCCTHSSLPVVRQVASSVIMGIKQNIRLWENHVEYIDENGVEVEAIARREWPLNPYKLVRMLSWKGWLFFFVGW